MCDVRCFFRARSAVHWLHHFAPSTASVQIFAADSLLCTSLAHLAGDGCIRRCQQRAAPCTNPRLLSNTCGSFQRSCVAQHVAMHGVMQHALPIKCGSYHLFSQGAGSFSRCCTQLAAAFATTFTGGLPYYALPTKCALCGSHATPSTPPQALPTEVQLLRHSYDATSVVLCQVIHHALTTKCGSLHHSSQGAGKGRCFTHRMLQQSSAIRRCPQSAAPSATPQVLLAIERLLLPKSSTQADSRAAHEVRLPPPLLAGCREGLVLGQHQHLELVADVALHVPAAGTHEQYQYLLQQYNNTNINKNSLIVVISQGIHLDQSFELDTDVALHVPAAIWRLQQARQAGVKQDQS